MCRAAATTLKLDCSIVQHFIVLKNDDMQPNNLIGKKSPIRNHIKYLSSSYKRNSTCAHFLALRVLVFDAAPCPLFYVDTHKVGPWCLNNYE